MREMPKDTIICIHYGRCKNHSIVKKIDIDSAINATSAMVVTNDSSNQLALDTQHIEHIEHEPLAVIKSIEPKHIAIDTIQNNVVSLTEDSTYQTQSHSVSIEPNMNVPMSYDVPVNGLVLIFTIYLTIKYAVDCVPHWANLINDLKQEMSRG